ncbi:MAG: histidine phosphatase family protein [Planctomycetes bacterium]|nr:histidine phosphatase family protein [Planctomycetota bacterium]MCB9906038.1 histidine phosphatase family protein [Planctomycetota bacterium]
MPNVSDQNGGESHDEQATPGGLSSCLGAREAAPTRRGFFLGLGAAPLAFAVGTEDEGAPPALESWTVFLVRHAEKGVDDPRDPALSEAGKLRAAALAELLAAAGVNRVFSTDYRRARDTAAPLADHAGVEVELYDPREAGAIVKTLSELPAGSVAVVVGHSNTTPQVLTALGAPEPRGLEDSRYGRILPEDCYDRLYLAHFARVGESKDARFAGSLELRYGS